MNTNNGLKLAQNITASVTLLDIHTNEIETTRWPHREWSRALGLSAQ
jgi:hypothetical protein